MKGCCRSRLDHEAKVANGPMYAAARLCGRSGSPEANHPGLSTRTCGDHQDSPRRRAKRRRDPLEHAGVADA